MSDVADTESVIQGVFKDGDQYGFRANVPGGKGRQVRRRGFPTQEAAYRARFRFLSGVDPKISGGSVAGWFEEFLTAKETEVEPTTLSGYRYCLDLITPHLSDVMLYELTETHLRQAYRQLITSHSTGTIETVHWRVRTALRQAVREGRLLRCPADNVTAPKGKSPRKKMNTWTFVQLMKFAQYTSTQRDAALWSFWITTGLRRGELCGLQWPKVDLDKGLVVVDWQRTRTVDGQLLEKSVKTEAGERDITLSSRVVSALREWRASQSEVRLAQGKHWPGRDFVFTSKLNCPYYPGSFSKRLTTLCAAAELPRLTPHELRHTYATRAVENGMEITLLSKLLGHSRADTTRNLYVHPDTNQKREANTALADRMFGHSG